ncbi:MAG: hypothetical protein ACI9H9_000179 [Pseudoalteromonas tetraodonis]|jgi:hypothetical protein
MLANLLKLKDKGYERAVIDMYELCTIKMLIIRKEYVRVQAYKRNHRPF